MIRRLLEKLKPIKKSPIKVDEINKNFDNYENEMDAFEKLLKKCIKDKTAWKNNYDDEYYKLIAKDKKTGDVENIIKIFKNRYEKIELAFEYLLKSKKYSHIIFRYKKVFIGVIVINEKYITFGCNLTVPKLEMAINTIWKLENGKSSSSKKQKSTQLSTSSKRETIIISNKGEEIYKDFKKLTPLTDFYKEIDVCLKQRTNTEKKYYESEYYELRAKNKKTFTGKNIIKILKEKYNEIKVILMEIENNEYTIMLKYKHIYISIQGYNNRIVLHCHPVKRLLNYNNQQGYEILHEYSD